MMTVSPTELKRWYSHIEQYRIPVSQTVEQITALAGRGLEIAAGTAWWSSLLSQSSRVHCMDILDIDENRLELARRYFTPRYGGDSDKIQFHVGDYHNLPFASDVFDFVVCDAGLHHAQNLSQLLNEIKRVLKPQSVLVAIR